jgi:membrane protease YdiL (CAAX protease family)
MPTTSKLLHHPLTRLIIGLALTLGIGLAGMYGAQQLLGATSLPQSDKDPISGTVFAILVCAIYILLYRRYENRTVTELSSRHLLRYLIGGTLVGAGLASAIILIQYFAHVLTVTSTRSFLPLLPTLWNTFVNSTVAEVAIIGIFFRLTEEWLGSYLALLLLAILFIALHINAPGATILSAFAVATHSAFLLGPIFMHTRSLWAPIAIHFAWDFSYAGIYGTTINGYTMPDSLLKTTTNGAELLTGGYFGPQGSIQAAALCVVVGLIFLQLSRKNNRVIQPSFQKPR